jgi:hypothetical protein
MMEMQPRQLGHGSLLVDVVGVAISVAVVNHVLMGFRRQGRGGGFDRRGSRSVPLANEQASRAMSNAHAEISRLVAHGIARPSAC